MKRLVASVGLLCALAFAAGDWKKVKDLKTGSDIRIYKKGAAKPIDAKSANVTEDKVIVIMKNQEMAIDKAEIDRIDYRPPAGKPVKTQSSEIGPDGNGGVNRSISSGAQWAGREGWQTVYRK
jgi:hypothetical protein